MRLVMKRCGAVVTAVCALAFGVPAAAEAQTTQTFTTSQSEFDPGVRNQGWWSPSFENFDGADNYFVGHVDGLGVRNFFTFDLSSACRASSVTLQLTRFEQTSALTYSLFDVSTPAATLNANDGRSQTIFDDLGSGTSFGSFLVVGGASNDVLSFPLNAAGVAAFNTTRGGFFSIGGKTPDGEDSFLFATSGVTGTQQLVVTCLERMVGKGSLSGGGKTASYAYIVRCDSPTNTHAPFEVRFGTSRFRLESSAARCIDDPAVPTPAAGFDTQIGFGDGTLTTGGTVGSAVIDWKFVDGGPGGSHDSAFIVIDTDFLPPDVFAGTAAPPGKFPGSTQTTGFNTAQLVP